MEYYEPKFLLFIQKRTAGIKTAIKIYPAKFKFPLFLHKNFKKILWGT